MPLFMYPFLNTTSKTRPFEYLRLTSLGVIGALVKVRRPPARGGATTPRTPRRAVHAATPRRAARRIGAFRPNSADAGGALLPTFEQVDDTGVINFLLSTEIIPLCLRTMEMGSELSKTVATFIVQKILLDDVRRAQRAVKAARPRAASRAARARRWASATSAPPRSAATPLAPCWAAWCRCWCVPPGLKHHQSCRD